MTDIEGHMIDISEIAAVTAIQEYEPVQFFGTHSRFSIIFKGSQERIWFHKKYTHELEKVRNNVIEIINNNQT